MGHYAKLGLNSKVISVLVVDNDDITDENGKEVEQLGIDYLAKGTGYPFWLQTSYNNNIRKNYAGIGFRYDDELVYTPAFSPKLYLGAQVGGFFVYETDITQKPLYGGDFNTAEILGPPPASFLPPAPVHAGREGARGGRGETGP